MAGRRVFIETVTERVTHAKELVLPLAALSSPEAPWTGATLRAMWERRAELEPPLREAVEVLHEFELPFVLEEEALLARGVTLEDDLLTFEAHMLEFERDFWLSAFERHRDRLDLVGLPAEETLCAAHRVGRALVLRTVRAHGAESFDEIAPLVGADPGCRRCRVAVTRLLVEELERRAAASADES